MSVPATMGSLEVLNGLVEHEPAWWIDVCARVGEGEPWWEMARERMVKPALFRAWISVDEKREKDFQAALAVREELSKEKARHRLSGFVAAEVREADINPAHVLKAIESTLGKGGIGVSVDTGGGSVTIIHESA